MAKKKADAEQPEELQQMLLRRFMALFRGYEKAHGQHTLEDLPDSSGKLQGKGATHTGGAAEKQYQVHLTGTPRVSLGLIPLLTADTCWFGAIDIDIKGEHPLREKVEALEQRVRQLDLPLVVCRSKSGGAHLYLFSGKDKPLPARLMQDKLTEFAANLGYGGSEIFPKQVTRVNENDRGNWINIAYFGALSKKTTDRYCLRQGRPLFQLEEFLNYAEQMRITASQLEGSKLKLLPIFDDGPPCLQHMVTLGLETGGRNTSLTNVAIYFKKARPDSWQEEVSEFNQKHVRPPLDTGELNQVLKNVARKDYTYTCKNPPLVNHCDRKLCVRRPFGVTAGMAEGELFPIENITKCISKDSVRWYVEHQGARAEITTDQILNPGLLQKVFLERFNVLILFGKSRDWHERLRELVAAADVISDPEDASRQGQFENLLDNFFNSSRPARNRDEIIKGNSYLEEGRVHFRSEDLFNYLGTRRFTYIPHEVWGWLKQIGARDKQLRVRGKLVRVWTLPEPEHFDQSKPLDLPPDVTEEML